MERKYVLVEQEIENIAKMIDDGKTFEEIENIIKTHDHSGNSWGVSYRFGFKLAKNKENMENVKRDFNIRLGGTGKEKGVIDPAVRIIIKGEEQLKNLIKNKVGEK